MVGPKMFDAVLPLRFSDHKRFHILDASLKKFVKDLRKLFIVVPDYEVRLFRPIIDDDRYEIIQETAIVPELRIFRQYPGWNKQQLIKLSAVRVVETDFYLTLDADIICVRPIRFPDLIRNGRSYCYKHSLEYSDEKFKQWYRTAEKILRIGNAKYHHDVTPVVLSKEAVLKLQQHLAQVSRKSKTGFNRHDLKFWGIDVLARFIPGLSLAEWRLYLLKSRQWTEYSLYFSFLEASGLFEKYHFLLDNRVSGNSIWHIGQYDSWSPADSFLGERTFYFSVIQSNTGIDPDEIWQKVRPFLQDE